jgi:hypothetical protein
MEQRLLIEGCASCEFGGLRLKGYCVSTSGEVLIGEARQLRSFEVVGSILSPLEGVVTEKSAEERDAVPETERLLAQALATVLASAEGAPSLFAVFAGRWETRKFAQWNEQ